MKYFFNSSDSDEAINAKNKYIDIYNQCKIEEADIIISIGGDGFLLKSLHDYHTYKKPFYGINDILLIFLSWNVPMFLAYLELT